MAKSDGVEYNSRSLTFAAALDKLKADKDHIYYERLISYFQKCSNTENTPEKKAEYDSAIERLEQTQEIVDNDFALVCGVSQSTISRWRSDTKPTLPPLEMPVKLAEVFGVTTDFILGRAELSDPKAQLSYDPFKELGFSFFAYVRLKTLKQQNPQKHEAYMNALNLILEQNDTEIGYEDDMVTPKERPTNNVLNAISEFLQKRYKTDNCWITETHPADLLSVLEQQSDLPNAVVSSMPAYHTLTQHIHPCTVDMYDAYLMSCLTESLRHIKQSLQPYGNDPVLPEK